MQKTAQYWINELKLKKHPEGGYYKEIYRSKELIKNECLPKRFSGDRNFSTSIYYLLANNDFSAFHKIKSDEQWHFYGGSSLCIYVISPSGSIEEILLGSNPEKGEKLTSIIEKDCWFAATPKNKNSFSLIGCTVSPGFDFNDFELGNKNKLMHQFPEHKILISKLTR